MKLLITHGILLLTFVFLLSQGEALAISVGDDAVPVTFEGFGRLYSQEDEMAKPMCRGNRLHTGEYLIYYSRLGTKSLEERYYPFRIYIPAQGKALAVGDSSAAWRITFSSCMQANERCASATVKSGSRWSQMMLINSGGAGEHMLLVGAIKDTVGSSEDLMSPYKALVVKMNAYFIDGPLAEQKAQSVSIDMAQFEGFLREHMPANYATRKFQVVSPGGCGS